MGQCITDGSSRRLGSQNNNYYNATYFAHLVIHLIRTNSFKISYKWQMNLFVKFNNESTV